MRYCGKNILSHGPASQSGVRARCPKRASDQRVSTAPLLTVILAASRQGWWTRQTPVRRRSLSGLTVHKSFGSWRSTRRRRRSRLLPLFAGSSMIDHWDCDVRQQDTLAFAMSFCCTFGTAFDTWADWDAKLTGCGRISGTVARVLLRDVTCNAGTGRRRGVCYGRRRGENGQGRALVVPLLARASPPSTTLRRLMRFEHARVAEALWKAWKCCRRHRTRARGRPRSVGDHDVSKTRLCASRGSCMGVVRRIHPC